MSEREKYTLSQVHIDSFGSAFNKDIGPFTPKMNVVYGANESGKTTLASFIGGVLFGWPDARSRKNTYKPENAERSGSLTFVNSEGEETVVFRGQNARGLQGTSDLVTDLDPDTFKTMFNLNSDELMGMNNASDMASRLLTAGSGTAVSPAVALQELDDRIATYTSKAAAAEHSIVNLTQKVADLKAKQAACKESLAQNRAQYLELKELEPRLQSLSEEYGQLTSELDSLNALKGALRAEMDKGESLAESKKRLIREASEVGKERDAVEAAFEDSSSTGILDSTQERIIRSNLDELQQETDRLTQAAERAKAAYTDSQAKHQIMQQADDQSAADGRGRSGRTGQRALSLVFLVVALLAGAFLVMQGKVWGSMSVIVTGLAIIVCAFLLGAAIMVMSLKPNKTAQTFQENLQKTQWVVDQDRLKYEAAQEDLRKHQEKVEGYLQHCGLQAADGSLRRARALLDAMREARQAAEIHEQRRAGIIGRITDANSQIQEHSESCRSMLGKVGCKDLPELQERIDQVSEKRNEIFHQLQACQNRAGELRQILTVAEGDQTFGEVKLQLEEAQEDLAQSKYEYARLLLARHRLAEAISRWEEKSQPEVYRIAGELMSRMTGGAWCKVLLASDGSVRVVNRAGREQNPLLLSTGTCQQLYLSLRMALLMVAKGVGRSVPLIADDILVNFDEERRVGTARALLDLAETRQVIFLTCHKEIADLLECLDRDVNVLHLS